jgi:hypothetical protein
MPTAEQCRAYAAEYQRLGQQADISIQRALGLCQRRRANIFRSGGVVFSGRLSLAASFILGGRF